MIWKIIVGMGVVIAVISGVLGLQNKFITCDRFEKAFADSIDIMQRMQSQQDMRDYDFAIESLNRDLQIECSKPDRDVNKCQQYQNDMKEFKDKRDGIRDSWKVKDN